MEIRLQTPEGVLFFPMEDTMRLKDFFRLGVFCAAAILCARTGSAQTCQIQGVTVGGYYTFASIGNGAAGSLLTPPATSTTGGSGSTGTPMYSATELGELLSGIASGVPFASSGTIYLNGAGSIVANSSTGVPTTVGSYVLNSDCTITVMLTDMFGTITTPASLQGIVLDHGAEIDLGVLKNVSTGTSSSTGSTGTGSTGTGSTTTAGALYESNVLIELVRPLSTTCAVSSLSGSYALIGTGTGIATLPAAAGSTSTTQTEAPFFWFASVDFNGSGSVIAPPVVPSTLSYLQYTGSYTVNADCTGTMTLNPAPSTSSTTGTSSTTSGSTLSVNFVLTQPSVPFNAGNPSQQASSAAPGIEFSLSSGTKTLFGRGVAQ
jgi:hypothetical protein